MAPESAALRIELASSKWVAGERLEGTVVVTSGVSTGLELSVLWMTSGTGTVDEGVIHFQKLGAEADGGHPVHFEVRLPLSPTSYSGEHVGIQWLVRVRDPSGTTCDAFFQVAPSR